MNATPGTPDELPPGQTVGRFVVEHVLGRGGMATVYRVKHQSLGSVHALKVLHLPFPAVRERLLLEGRVQASLAHPNVVAVTDLVEVAGAPGLVMEFVPGRSLDLWRVEARPTMAQLDSLFRGVLDAIGYAHERGLIHRDLKPANILVHEVGGKLIAKVSDFGLAKLLDGESGPTNTRTGFAMGTPGYMAPEQMRNAKDTDARADVFALGCILYELWCGLPPFRGESVFDVLMAIERQDYPDPAKLRPDVPDAVARTIRAALLADREERTPSVAALRAMLDAEPATQPTPAGPPPIPVALLGPAATPATPKPVPTPAPEGAAPPPAAAETPAVAAPSTLGAQVIAPPLRPPAPRRRPAGGVWKGLLIAFLVIGGVALLAAMLVSFTAFLALLGLASDTGMP